MTANTTSVHTANTASENKQPNAPSRNSPMPRSLTQTDLARWLTRLETVAVLVLLVLWFLR